MLHDEEGHDDEHSGALHLRRSRALRLLPQQQAVLSARHAARADEQQPHRHAIRAAAGQRADMIAVPVDPGPQVPEDDWALALDPECAAVGCGGCNDALLEYPCRCFNCRGALSAVADEHGDCFHDGELTWWRCEFCRRFFDLDDLELLSGDGQACEPCVSRWEGHLRAQGRMPEAGKDGDSGQPAPGAASVA
jgi:hypothetical protein